MQGKILEPHSKFYLNFIYKDDVTTVMGWVHVLRMRSKALWVHFLRMRSKALYPRTESFHGCAGAYDVITAYLMPYQPPYQPILVCVGM